MPEGDTVRRTSTRLHQALARRALLFADLRWPGLSTAEMSGVEVAEVTAYGKHILTRFATGWTLRSHLRMDGVWMIEATTEAGRGVKRSSPAMSRLSPASSQVRAILANAEWTAIGMNLGMLDLVRTSAEHTLLGHLGPDLLADDFDSTVAVANLAASNTTLGAALLDQTNLAGIGTFWSCEGLFTRRLNPWTPAAEFDPAELGALVRWTRRLMTANLAHAVQSTTGSRRRGETCYVHARNGRPCRRCGSGIRAATIGPPTKERPMFYCPDCQGGLAPTDDGRPQRPLGSRG